LRDLVERSHHLIESGNVEELQENASEYGYDLLQVAMYNIDALGDGIREMLINTGRSLHLIETITIYMDGGISLSALQDRVRKSTEELDQIIQSLESNIQA